MRQLINSSNVQHALETRDLGSGLEFRDAIRGSLDLDDDYARNAILWVIRGI